MSRNPTETRDRICRSAAAVLSETGPFRFTIDLVAARTGCAKGLVHYHFGSKFALVAELIRRRSAERTAAWREALSVPEARDAVAATWRLVLHDAEAIALQGAGVGRLSPETEAAHHAADRDFADMLGQAVSGLMDRTGLRFGIPSGDVGAMLAASVAGSVERLAAGAPAASVEEAYALVWLGLLSLTETA